MRKYLIIAVLIKLLLIVGFHGLVWQADQVMDKAGIGDIDAWRRFNDLASITFYGVALMWLATIIISIAGRVIQTTQAQLAIGLPPLALVLGWFLLWVI